MSRRAIGLVCLIFSGPTPEYDFGVLTRTPPDLQHNLFVITFDNKLGFAPPNDTDSDVKNVLDIGTGTGIWATDFGDEHPGAKVRSLAALIGKSLKLTCVQVIGVDLSPIQSSL